MCFCCEQLLDNVMQLCISKMCFEKYGATRQTRLRLNSPSAQLVFAYVIAIRFLEGPLATSGSAYYQPIGDLHCNGHIHLIIRGRNNIMMVKR